MLSEVEKAILEKMLLDKIIGGKHTSADNIPKGFPKHLRGEAKDSLKSLIKKVTSLPNLQATAWKFRLTR